MEKNKQTKQPYKRPTPTAARLDEQKRSFLKALRKNGGHVSSALASSGLKRWTAYQHFKDDKEFAEAWVVAIEEARDAIFMIARDRALNSTGPKSDRLLIFLLKNAENQRKWRTRLLRTAHVAMNSVQDAGTRVGLSEDQIRLIQEWMMKEFEHVPLVA